MSSFSSLYENVAPAHAVASALEQATSASRGLYLPPENVANCRGQPRFRSQLSRDLGCLLDADPDVSWWQCLAGTVTLNDGRGSSRLHVPDFYVCRIDGTHSLVDAVAGKPSPSRNFWIPTTAPSYDENLDYQVISEAMILCEPKLSNIKDLLGSLTKPGSLKDRIALLVFLEAFGPARIIDCIRHLDLSGNEIGAIATLYFQSRIEIDLEDGLIGPETFIRRR